MSSETGIVVERRNTTEGINPLDRVTWEKKTSTVLTENGEANFEMDEIETPSHWSNLATEIFASKYFKGAKSINEGRGERSVRVVIERVVDTLADQGVKQGYFKDGADKAFRDELAHALVHQEASFNSPVWFNCGLFEKYGLAGTNIDNYYWDAKTATPVLTSNCYEHPQLSACFIQGVKDDLMDIADQVKREMKIFSGGSGVGTNYSSLRSIDEPLSSGGSSSGVMSFLKIYDVAAGSTKSGGKNRRAAKMVILDAEHPEIFEFVRWKAREEEKAQMLIAAGLPSDFNGEAYDTVSGQNSNNSVRVSDEFMQAVQDDGDWQLKAVTTGQVVRTVKARELFKQICEAAWKCADPGLQFSTTINSWHTCPKDGEIRASNPCSEIFATDSSVCNLGSINLVRFLKDDGFFDITGFQHLCRLFTIAQDIIIDYASYPTKEMCENTHGTRLVGLGFTNLGGLLMRMGLPYDSERGRTVIAAITSLLTATAYKTSTELAEAIGPFSHWKRNKQPMQKVIERHRRSSIGINEKMVDERLYDAANQTWDEALELGKKSGFRNAQISMVAPAGTTSFVLDADTTGIEPDYALVKLKKYAGGGFSKIVNRAVPQSLRNLGYTEDQVRDIDSHMLGHGKLPSNGNSSGVCVPVLKSFGLSDEAIEAINEALPHCLDIDAAIRMVPDAIQVVSVIASRHSTDGELGDQSPLRAMGFTDEEIAVANAYSCGHMCLEGAPHLRSEHLAVFDCASTCGPCGKRKIATDGHLNMVATVQPFVSGGISKTLSLPAEATVQDVWDVFVSAWLKGIKCVTVYRDGCKASQPLSSKADTSKESVSSKPVRKKMPMQRVGGRTLEVKIGGHKVFLTANAYEDGTLGEIFILASKPSSMMGGLLHCFARMVSIGLQYGVPLEKLVETFTFEEFEPYGLTTHPNITQCKSMVDFIFRWLALEFLNDTSYSQVKPNQTDVIPRTEPVAPLTDAAPKPSGHTCSKCHSTNLRRTGTCFVCEDCGTSQGCS